MATRIRTRIANLTRASTLLRPSISLRQSSTFRTGPSPPRLPASEQAEFERLQRIANTQSGFNATSTPDFSSPTTTSSPSNPASSSSQSSVAQSTTTTTTTTTTTATTTAITEGDIENVEGEGEGVSTPLRKGAPPEFEGEVNPRTGEVGGPKNEPLRWGAGGDYSYNGRVTDF
ncbi:hypothetical protein F4679DRAFT_561031 [Xylaria curta]|nr:hypothetical protein F4679DRAFT_561031 [Xylaria curta]